MSPLLPERRAAIVRRTAGDPKLLSLEVGVENLRTVQWKLDRACKRCLENTPYAEGIADQPLA